MLNKVILMGRLTADPNHRQTPNNIDVTSFTLAVNRSYKGKDGSQQADFIDIVAWRNTATFVDKYFKKGQQVVVEGSLQARNYEDKQGNKRTAVEVIAEQVYFAEGKQPSSDNGNPSDNFPVPPPQTSQHFNVGFDELDGFDELQEN